MTDVLIESLRVRGPGAARLARVAARALPEALDRALADLPDARVGEIAIRLDVDLDGCDDQTLALLWAQAIRAQVRARVGPARVSPRAGPAGRERARPAARPVSGAAAVAAAESWLAAADLTAPLRVEALALARDPVRREAATAAGEARIVALLQALAEALGVVPRRAPTAGPPGLTHAPPAPVGPRPENDAEAGDHARRAPSGPDTDDEVPAPPGAAARTPRHTVAPAAGPDRASSLLADLADALDPGAATLDPAAVTVAAGLPLLYPWLADLCRRAVELHPGLDAGEVRAQALGATVDPDALDLARDPLIALLAGVPARTTDAPPAPLAHRDDAVAAGEEALAAFAGLLPGFAGSTAPFVRREWIVRPGIVETDADPVRLTAATRPLDVVLPRLPYPVGLIKMPWSPAVSVRFRP